jgi:hypothetical protein
VLERFVSVGEMLHEDSNVFADQSRIPRLDVAILGTSWGGKVPAEEAREMKVNVEAPVVSEEAMS